MRRLILATGIVSFTAALCVVIALANDPTSRAGDAGQGVRAAAEGQTQSSRPENSRGARKNGPQASLTAQQQNAAVAFAREHHRDLEGLLVYLKENRQSDYDRATRDLYRTSERLGQIRERDRDLYELELSLWKAQSRAQLLAARFKMDRDEAHKGELKTELAKQHRLRIQILRHNKQKMLERIEKLDAQIEQVEKNHESLIERQINLLTGASKTKTSEKTKKVSENAGRKPETNSRNGRSRPQPPRD